MQEWSVQGSWFAAALAVLGSWTTPARATISMFTRVPSIDDLTFGNYRICDRLSLLLVVQSTSAVQSVRGRIDTFEFDLTQDSGNEWTASMDIPPLAYGMHPLVITATNADGEQAVFSREFMCDRAPVVHVAAPVAGLATTGPVTIEASCTDDGPDGCAGLKVVYSASSQLGQSAEFANLVACGTDRISGTYDLSRFAGMSAALHFIAYEANGTLRGFASVPATVTGSPRGAGAVSVSTPVSGQVARPEIEIVSSCGKDCAGMYVWYERAAGPPVYTPVSPDYRDVLACGSKEYAQTLDLSRYEGTRGRLVFASVHDPQRSQARFVDIAVESSPDLCEVERVRGRILHADARRVLLASSEMASLQIYDRDARHYRSLSSAAGLYAEDWWQMPRQWARLTPSGAVFTVEPSALWEARGDALLQLAAESGGQQAAGNFVLWSEPSGWNLRDLSTQATYSVAEGAGDPRLAANGDVVFTSEGQVFRYRQGAVTQLTFDAAIKREPATDGSAVAYEKLLDNRRSLALLGASGETAVDPEHAADGSVDFTAELAAGWLAFTRSDADGISLRAPDGLSRQVTDLRAQIEGLNDRGEVMSVSTGSYDRVTGTIMRRRLSLPDGSFVDNEQTVATPLLIDGSWHMIVAGSLFRITTTGDCDGGVGQVDPDAGLVDAGLADAARADAAALADADGADSAAGDAGLGGDPDAAHDASEEPAPDAAPDLDSSGEEAPDASEDEDAASEPAGPDADAPSEERDAEMMQRDAGRRWRGRRDFDCAVGAPGAPARRSDRPLLAGLGLLFACASWTRARGRRRAAR